jgi:Domain of unknown function (DUF1707)
MSTERETPRLRASDAERERVAAIVQAATGDGRLTTAEAEERLTAVYSARFTDEFGPLVADLPAPRREEPQPRILTRPLAVHAVVVVALSTLLIVRWIASGVPFFWPAGPMTWLVVTLLVHAGIRRARARRAEFRGFRDRAEFTHQRP